jgi:anti-sigma factor RsiW
MKIEDDLLDLLNRDIDGDLCPEELDLLHRLLAGNSEAADYHRHLQQLAGELESRPRVEPPPGLKARVLHSLPEGRVRTTRPDPATWMARIWQTHLGPGRGVPLALGTALGAVIMAIVLVATLQRPLVDPSQSRGTLLLPDSSAFSFVLSKHIGGSTSGVEARVSQNGETILVDLATDPVGPESLTVRFPQNELSLLGFQLAQTGPVPVFVGPGELTVVAAHSPRIFVFLHHSGSGDSSVRIRLAGLGGTEEVLPIRVPATH